MRDLLEDPDRDVAWVCSRAGGRRGESRPFI